MVSRPFSMKKCFKCEEVKPLDEFYAHPRMRDGRLNKCKACAKCDVNLRYAMNPEKMKAYEDKRSRDPERKKKCKEYMRLGRIRNPQKSFARQALGNAVRDGRIKRLPCEICGNPKSEGHHENYSKPLEVRWLCFTHHRMAHGQLVS